MPLLHVTKKETKYKIKVIYYALTKKKKICIYKIKKLTDITQSVILVFSDTDVVSFK